MSKKSSKGSASECPCGMMRVLRWLLYIMPACLFLSYQPVIRLGGNETMNFELSVAVIWLVIFDVVGLIAMIQKKRLFRNCGGWWKWVIFPLWVSLTVIWSLNVTRGVLTAGMMWAIVTAIYIIWSLRDVLGSEFRMRWWKWFYGATLVACGWCFVQCVLDLVGVSQDYSLMCDGCTYRMFGFPHPNGFAIEPQFMGNLLLAPIMVSIWFLLKDDCNSTFRTRVAPARRHGRSALILGRNLRNVLKVLLPIVFTVTLFLTFSRGAIYAFVVGLCFLSGYKVARVGKKQRKMMWKRVGVVWGIALVSFFGALNLQGIMAEVSPTNDTYITGVAKVLNHLSLGVIDIRGDGDGSGGVVEKSVEKSDEVVFAGEVVEHGGDDEKDGEAGQTAVFDGYVAESTDTRMRLTGAALTVWSGDFKTMAVGVGLGGAGQALYNNGLSPAPKEIVQNEYASLLLETGLVGVVLFVVLIVMVVKLVLKQKNGNGLVFGLLVAYGVTLLFFSGLPNALQVYLMPVILMVVL